MEIRPDIYKGGGISGTGGGTYSKDTWDQTIWNIFGDDVYLRTVDAEEPLYYYIRGVYEDYGYGEKFLKEHTTWDNLTIEKE